MRPVWRLGLLLGCALLLVGFPRCVAAQTPTGLAITVLDGANRPQADVVLQVVDPTTGWTTTVTTNASGAATVTDLPPTSPAIHVDAATVAGQPLGIEPTTLTDLRIGLLPGHVRPVLLRVTDGRLWLDPETLFAGGDATGAPVPLAIPTALVETPTYAPTAVAMSRRDHAAVPVFQAEPRLSALRPRGLLRIVGVCCGMGLVVWLRARWLRRRAP